MELPKVQDSDRTELGQSRCLRRGPAQRFITGNLKDFRQDILGFFERCAREYGDVVDFRLGHVKCVLLSHPQLIDEVLVKQSTKFGKHYGARFARNVLGNGLVTNDGVSWQRQRRLISPAFSSDRVTDYGSEIVDAGCRMRETWRNGEVRNIHVDASQLALDVVTRTLLGGEITDVSEFNVAISEAISDFARRSNSTVPLPPWIPTLANLRLGATKRRLNSAVRQVIAQRRDSRATRGDLLSLLVNASDGMLESAMSEEQLLDEVRTFLLAGHETSALALTWTLYLLAKHENAQLTLRTELKRVLSENPPEAADLGRLPFLQNVMLESMRLYPPSFVLGREAKSACEVCGYGISKGTTVFMSQWIVHRDARFFDKPGSFIPERWSDTEDTQRPRFAYFPFGGGSRSCIGSAFARLEIGLLLITILQKWTLRLLDPSKEVLPAPLFTLRPGSAVEVVVSSK